MTYWRAVSLFSNCGAGDVGYRDAGFRFDVMAELDERRLEVALLNHPGAVGVPGDLRETWHEVVRQYRLRAGNRRPALLSACPPCQGMSSANGDRGRADDAEAGSRDKRNLLVVVVANVALELLPKAIAVENVQEFLTRKILHPITGEVTSAAKLLINLLHEHYYPFPILSDLSDYGVPQYRKRTFLTFVRRDLSGLRTFLRMNRAPYPRPTHAPDGAGLDRVTLGEALRSFNLPSLDARSAEAAADPKRPLHFVPIWGPDDRRYAMVSAIPTNSGASAWENEVCGACGPVTVGEDDATCPRCRGPLLRPVVQEQDGTYRLIKGFRGSSYRRMTPDEPAATVTTASGHVGSDLTIHPYENRLMSPLEVSLLQTFPHDFAWGDALEEWGHTNVRAMIGEAVPPLFTRLHGAVLMGLLTNNWTLAPISLSDPRCLNASRKLGLRLGTPNAQARPVGVQRLLEAGEDVRQTPAG